MSIVQKEAPNFTTQAVVNGDFKSVSLSDYKGKWVYLFFYPFDFTFVCPTEIIAFSEANSRFEALNTQVLGCSIDSHFVHLKWIDTPRSAGGLGGINFPLLADVNKQIAQDYGVLLEPGMALTVEPGLYIAPDDDSVDEQWRGIGIRIEDDVVVTKEGCEVMTHEVPKDVAEIERLMKGG